jgi:hypothetical protein
MTATFQPTIRSMGALRDVIDRLNRLEDALIDLAIMVSQGHLDDLDSANMSSDIVRAGKRLQEFHRAVVSERAS